LIGGIFVGGQATRMGGRPKGLLPAPGGTTIVERWRALFDEKHVPVVLVGAHAAYEPLGLPIIADAAPGHGPLGGLVALLRHAAGGVAITAACDMPFVSGALLGRLLDASAEAPIVAPRRDGRWEPLFAAYDAARVLPLAEARLVARELSLQGLLDAAGARELPLAPHEEDELRDYDRPEDLP
jgi:molybdopterin-guanine dinucleotide biosynthesis protein A